jgi:hypothetical protein
MAAGAVFRSIVANRAAAHNALFADPYENFDQHRICSSTPWVNPIVSLDLATDLNLGLPLVPYHPNNNGHALAILPSLESVAP